MYEPNGKMFFNYNTSTHVLHTLMQCQRCDTLDIVKDVITIECDGCGAKIVVGGAGTSTMFSYLRLYVAAGVGVGLLGSYVAYSVGKLIFSDRALH